MGVLGHGGGWDLLLFLPSDRNHHVLMSCGCHLKMVTYVPLKDIISPGLCMVVMMVVVVMVLVVVSSSSLLCLGPGLSSGLSPAAAAAAARPGSLRLEVGAWEVAADACVTAVGEVPSSSAVERAG